MTEHKFTDEEVIEALKHCLFNLSHCSDCPLFSRGYETCHEDLYNKTIDLINRQKAEIEWLTSAVDNSTQEFLKLHDTYQDQKAEIERLKSGAAEVVVLYILDVIRHRIIQNEKDKICSCADSAKGIYSGKLYAYRDIMEILKQQFLEGKR